ncbi:UDP-forming cellulose synthase catalytic subunit [Novacetimonas hansenii]|uniref:UDP-forming cellulose synthase catalytic subunit n=1 Tax=Novacetimonas hansenii TaxID=436 RepID=UPI000A815D94|nr:UDP-forming cellulose synthase catalytic subunit [Novacetimonas hansenii]
MGKILSIRGAGLIIGVFGLCALIAATSVTLPPEQQLIVAFVCVVIFFIVGHKPSRRSQIFLEVLSGLVSLRYLTWRLTETLSFDTWLQGLLGTMLLVAELYALMMLFLSYFQTIAPLHRAPLPLPPNPDEWPTVDIFVPTYNEELSIVRLTVLGSLGIDWPPEKVRVHILDDGRRPEFAAFAAECGANYIARPTNEHAKAGNLNYAIGHTDGDYILIFDCDHVPTRAFLQLTMGWMVEDPKIALMQTPHHFYSPDPFQRNLSAGYRTPPEGNLFYGVVQDGNDFWDATFFCGSCAILRRTAIEQIGGFATQTVTEDAHTALKMQRLGWSTAYLRIPLAGGLATERLILHIGQRVRWARGMLQIFRIDNPLFGRGLSWGQRLCYLSAMTSFLFAVPRVIFLSSPLAFLFFGQNIIAASPLALLAYAIPHMFHAVGTASKINKGWRYSFWSEVYETTMALFLVRVTIVTLLSPSRGKFNVTDKGGLLEKGYFDLGAVYPNIILGLIMFGGLARGVYELSFGHLDQIAERAYLLNSAWAMLSLIIILAAIAVGRETQQKRNSHRIPATIPVEVANADGSIIVTGVTEDLSMGGAAVKMSWPAKLSGPTPVYIRTVLDGEELILPARIIRAGNGRGIFIWTIDNLQQEFSVIRLVFGRADAWVDWGNYKADRPLLSLMDMVLSVKGLFRSSGDIVHRSSPTKPSAGNALSDDTNNPSRKERVLKGTVKMVSLLALLTFASSAQAASAPKAVAAKAPAHQPEASDLPPLPALLPATSGAAQAGSGDAGANGPGSPTGQPLAADSADALVENAENTSDTATVHNYTLKDLGAAGSITMRGLAPLQGIEFGIPSDQLVTSARLVLSGSMSPNLRPETNSVTMTLNEQYIGTLRPDPAHPTFGPMSFEINPIFFVSGNRLNFNFASGSKGCSDITNDTLWATISQNSQLQITTIALPPRRLLSRLPQPFYDKNVRQHVTVPMVLAQTYDPQILKSAGILASWFGKQTDFLGVTFPVSSTIPQSGNAILIGVADELPTSLGRPQVNGPAVLELPNPSDANATILVVTGRDRDEVITASKGIAFASAPLPTDSHMDVAPVDIAPRKPNDAPSFIAMDHPVRFGDLVTASKLQGTGFTSGVLSVPFRIPPDLYTWRNRPYKMQVRFRSPAGEAKDVEKSRLDVGINEVYLHSYPLRETHGLVGAVLQGVGLARPASGMQVHDLDVPPWTVFGQDQLNFYFDAMPLARGICQSGAANNAFHLGLDPDSTIDFSRAHHIAQMPNLAYMATVGFPFTTYADLSQTAVVLPEHPNAATVGAYLDLMGFMGAATWYPVAGVDIVSADHVSDVADRNLLVISTLATSGEIAPLLSRSSYEVADGHLRTVSHASALDNAIKAVDDPLTAFRDRDSKPQDVDTPLTGGVGAMIEAESPLTAGRTVLALLSSDGAGLNNLLQMLGERKKQANIQGDLVVAHGEDLSSYRTSPVYTIGTLPLWLWPDWYMHNRPVRVLLVGLLGCILIVSVLARALARHATRRFKQLEDERRKS